MFSKYTSTGIIKQLKVNGGLPGTKLFFVPDCHHSVRHDNTLYAVFMPPNSGSPPPDFDVYAVKCDPKRGCCIQVESSNLDIAMSHAATNQCKVKVNIERRGKNLLLISVTIPAE